MGTLSSCLKKIGLSQHEAAILRGATDDNIKDGDEAHVAAVRAVADYIEQLDKERAAIVAQIDKAGGVAPDAPFKLADLAELTSVLRKGAALAPVAYNQDKQPEKQDVTDQRSSADLERNRQDAEAQDSVGTQGVRDGRGSDVRAGEQRVPGRQGKDEQLGGSELLRLETPAAGEPGHLEIYTGATTVSDGAAGSLVDIGSGDSGIEGAPIEPDAAEAIERAATGRSELGNAVAAQAAANKEDHRGAGIDNVRAALPMLHQGQLEDVVFAEQRFAVDDGYGVLFTNGTGTGKTFTGLGVVRRFVSAGKSNVIIVAPNDKIIEDWQKSGKMLGLDISRLDNTKDAGSGVVITTYANFGANEALADRNWDLVVSDEAHYMVQSKDANVTNAVSSLRAITLHPDGAHRRANMIHRELVAKIDEMEKEAKRLRSSDDERAWYEGEALEQKIKPLRRELEQKRDDIKSDIASRQGKERTRALFLSATPFAYEKTIDWANGYLFDYNEGQASEENSFRGYNEGSNRDRFFMQHFGYRMRYNKLTEPDARVDRGMMQRQFNSWLKKRGAVSGRMLDVEADYDRRFILTESAVGTRIDQALEWFDERQKEYNESKNSDGGIGSYQSDPYSMALGSVRKYIADKFDYLSRRYLLEAIKAKEVIPHVKEHLALGRKVVVFHDYKKGGGFNPFNVHEMSIDAAANDEQRQHAEMINRVISEFRYEFADLVEHEVFDSSSPIDAFKEAFPDVLLFNGDVPSKQRRANVAKFNDDASGPQVILVQSAAGKEGISLHDTTGVHQRVLFNLGQPTQPTTAIQEEGRTYRTGQVTDAIFRYLTTGTNWEKWAFATTIAQRASAAENLGMGEQARALKDAFIEAYEEADDYRAGMDGEGKGGKERDRAANQIMSEFDRAKAFYYGTQKKTSKNKAKEGADYFATPEPVGYKMVEFAGIRGGNKVLEPSAGHGAIARWFPENADRTTVEPSSVLRPRLAMVFDGKIIDSDFESLNVVNKYDAIVMNPPFGTGGKIAVEHLAKAATHLNDGGRIVALMPSGPMADKRLEKWLYEEAERDIKPIFDHPKLGAIYRGDVVTTTAGWATEAKVVRRDVMGNIWIKPEGGSETTVNAGAWTAVKSRGPRTERYKPAANIQMIADIKLPSVTFERAGTGVMTHIVVLEKQMDAAKASDTRGVYNRDLSRIDDINSLFDQIENMALPARPMTAAELAAEQAEAEAPKRNERPQKAEKPAVDIEAASQQAQAEGLEIIEYTTKKGKKLKGVIRTDLTKEQAQEIDKYTWKMNGGYFIRAEHMSSQAYKDSLGGDAPATLSASLGRNDRNTAVVVDAVAANDAIAAAMSGLEGAPSVTLAESFSDLPPEIQAEAKDQDAGEADFKGAYKRGHIWILRANHATVEDIEATLFHELYGHHGTRVLFGNKWMQEINKLYASVGGWNGVKAIAAKRGINLEDYRKGVLNWDGDKKIWRDPVMMEELLAHMAEQQPNQKLMQRISDGIKRLVGMFRQWLRDKGFAQLAQRGETDLLHILAQASQAVREGKSVKSGPAFSVLSRGDKADTIEVDGVLRPTLNSAGKQIHPTDEGLRNFWRWFGDSKVVDAEGRPMVVYHGTSADIEAFDPEKIGSNFGLDSEGFFFSGSPVEASGFADPQSQFLAAGMYDDRNLPPREGGNVIPVYLSINSPLTIESYTDAFYTNPTEEIENQGIGLVDYFDDNRRSIIEFSKDGGNDGVLFKHKGKSLIVAFSPTQIKSATGNNGNFDPNEAPIMMRRSVAETLADKLQASSPKIADALRDTFATNEKFGWWHKTLGTQHHKAHLDKDFAKVYHAAQAFERDTARMASEAADLAPDLLPKMDGIGDTLRTAKNVKRDAQDSAAISPWVYYGTLAESVFTDEQLRNPDAVIAKFGQLLPESQPLKPLTERQIKLYRQYHSAINKSLEDLAISEMGRLARMAKLDMAEPTMTMHEAARFYFEQISGEIQRLSGALEELQEEQKAEAKLLEDAAEDEATGADQRKRYAKLLMDMKAKHKEQREAISAPLADLLNMKEHFIGRAMKIKELQDKGYAPLMRFGKYTVDVTLQDENGKVLTDADGNELRPFFGMFESEAEANAVARELREEYPDHAVTQGILSEHQHQLFQGITPENVELYAKAVGMDTDEAFQRYLKLATANRSAMKRLIHRKGTAGFSFDATRSLASFITSNSRAASSNLHIGDMLKAVADIDKTKGDVKDEAIKLMEYVRSPAEGGVAIRSLLFFQYLGGSVASALVNMTQTFTTTFPYLSQDKFGGPKKAAEELRKAMAMSAKRMHGGSTGDKALDALLKRAEEEGVVAPHEIHMLQGEAGRGSGVFANSPLWRSLENKYPALRFTSRFIDAGKSLWGSFFSLAEQYNRQVAFIAAYQMAKQQGKSEAQAYAMAEQAVEESQFNYQKSARPNWARSAVGATLLTFKTFLINYLEFLKRLPNRERAIAVGMLVLLAGAQGAPGADDLDDIIDTIGQAAGYSTNSKRWKREVLADVFGNSDFGKAASGFILHGVSEFLPMDISGRLSVGNIIPATSLFKRDNTSTTDEVAELVGPAGGLAKKLYEGAKGVMSGDDPTRMLMYVAAPKAIADAYQGVDMLQTGIYRDYRGRKVTDASALDAAVKAIGFQPNDVATIKRAERLVQQDIALFRNVKQDIAERWARGIFERDTDKVAKAREELRAWNEKNPSMPMAVKNSQIQRRVTEMKKTSGERVASASPKEIRGNVEHTLRAGELQ